MGTLGLVYSAMAGGNGDCMEGIAALSLYRALASVCIESES